MKKIMKIALKIILIIVGIFVLLGITVGVYDYMTDENVALCKCLKEVNPSMNCGIFNPDVHWEKFNFELEEGELCLLGIKGNRAAYEKCETMRMQRSLCDSKIKRGKK